MGAAVRYGARCRQGDHRGGGGRFGVAKRPHRRRCLTTNVVHVADVLVAHCLSPAADKREGGLGGRPAEGILILGVECGAVGKAAARPADGESAAGGAGDGLSIDGGEGSRRRLRPGAAARRRYGSFPRPESVWAVGEGPTGWHGARPCRQETVDKRLFAEGSPIDLVEPVVRVARRPPTRSDAFDVGKGGCGHGM